jgi:membrane associated rhomboid family serine protease
MRKAPSFGSWKKAFLIALFFVVVMWICYWAQHLFAFNFYTLGVLPRTIDGLVGILTMPFVHSQRELNHIVNNSIPCFLLISSLFYYYQNIAWKVLLLGWIFTGCGVWIYAENTGAYHIGMSGIIYFLAGFLFVSGVLRKYLPLQALSLFIVFLYGSMIWGIFPMEEKISWEGHFVGLAVGMVMAFVFRESGPQRPKFQYEIEKELGIEPPDFEGMYLDELRRVEEEQRLRNAQEQNKVITDNTTVIYHYRSNPLTNDTSDK